MVLYDSDSNLYLRLATLNDKDLLFEWANDVVTRQNSFSTKQISYSEHCNWFDSMMKNANRFQYIVMQDSLPVGQVRIDIEGSSAEISYSIAPDYRGKGFGTKALSLIKEEVEKNHPKITRLFGQIKPENTASQKAFIKEGFEQVSRQYVITIKR
jgi:RimJ/RimL family protein N-acetyltransferase